VVELVIRHVEEVSGNVALTCRYYGISRQECYVWYRRYQTEGVEGLHSRSKRPKTERELPRQPAEPIYGHVKTGQDPTATGRPDLNEIRES
jgi:hypothetical protein